MPSKTPKSVNADKLPLLRALPVDYQGELFLIHRCFGLPFISNEKVHASIRSGFLVLRKIEKNLENSIQGKKLLNAGVSGLRRKGLVKFIPLAKSKILPVAKKPLCFTVCSDSGVTVSLQGKNNSEVSEWVSRVKKEAEMRTINLKDFVVLDTFGRGHFGEVNIIAHKHSKDVFALKSMSMKGSENELNIYERVILEKVNNLKDEFHVHSLPRLHFAFSRGDDLYLLSDAYLGGNLLDKIKEQPNRQFSEQTAIYIAAELILGLQALHSVYIGHRDIKPENVMLSASGHIKLIDFGLSKQFKVKDVDIPDNVNKTSAEKMPFNYNVVRSYAVLGTTYYQSPEMLRGFGHNLTLDWWQLGCLVYELLFGVPLFRGKTSSEIEGLIISNDEIVIPDRNKLGQLSAECVDFMSSLLIRQPSDRLGFRDDAKEIMDHAWFSSREINWTSFRNHDEDFRETVPHVLLPNEDKILKLDNTANLESKDSLEERLEKLHGKIEVERKSSGVFSSKTDSKILPKPAKMRKNRYSDKDLSRLGLEYTYSKSSLL